MHKGSEIRRGLFLAALAFGPVALAASPGGAPQPAVYAASADVRTVTAWALASHDSRGLPFIVVDKREAQVFVYAGDGRLLGETPALLGLARGDESVPGIGQRALAAIAPGERTTPAGRFEAAPGRDLEKDVLWIDYDAALSLHRVVVGHVSDHRERRLASASSRDNRISYGCINVPAQFYDEVVAPAFRGTMGIVYILPETKPLRDVFSIPDISADNANYTRSPAR